MKTINFDQSASYIPRPPQQEIHNAVKSNRNTVVVAHRRMGKTVGAINQLIHSAWKSGKKQSRYAYVAPTYSQAKRVAWDILIEHTRLYQPTINVSELRVDFAVGDYNWRISLYGADNVDALRGIGLDGAVVDEVADINPRLYTEVLRPALAENKGFMLFIGTPKGRNAFKDLRDKADSLPDWKLLEFKASDTNILDSDELATIRKEIGDDKYYQEFECSFNAAIEGSYYGKQINELEEDDRITTIPLETLCQTYCAWDLGMGDSTSIWVAQTAGKEVRLVDYIENHGQGLDYYVSVLRDKGFADASQLLPHDVEVRELGTGKSRKEMLQQAGLNITVVPRLNVDDGIQAVRSLLPRCWFDKQGTQQGLDALRNYRREYDDKRNIFYNKPLHNWCSHAADAFRYLAVGLDEVPSSWGKSLNVDTRWVV